MESIYNWLQGKNPSVTTKDKSQAPVPPVAKVQGYAAGGTVAPGGGQSPVPPSDTIPMMGTPGEFVIPQPVVQYLGEKFFNDLIAKATAELGGGGAPNEFTQMANEDDVLPQGLPQ